MRRPRPGDLTDSSSFPRLSGGRGDEGSGGAGDTHPGSTFAARIVTAASAAVATPLAINGGSSVILPDSSQASLEEVYTLRLLLTLYGIL